MGPLLGTYGMGLGSPLGSPPRVWGKRVIFYTPRIAQKWEKQARVQGKTGVFGLWGPQNWPSWLWGGTGNVRLNGPFRQHMKMRVTSTGLQRVVAPKIEVDIIECVVEVMLDMDLVEGGGRGTGFRQKLGKDFMNSDDFSLNRC